MSELYARQDLTKIEMHQSDLMIFDISKQIWCMGRQQATFEIT